MQLATYFTILIYILMTATGLVLALIFLYAYFGEEQKKEE